MLHRLVGRKVVNVDEAAGPVHVRRWLTGLRRAWISSGALESWISHRGVTGSIWTPASYDIDDLSEPVARLTSAGAKPDAALLWDMAIDDVRAAADLLRGVHSSSDGTDGYVVVWLDPSRASDPDKALGAAADLAGDIRRSNIAVGLAWTSARSAVVQALIGSGMPVAVSGVRDTGTFGSVVSVQAAGTDRRRSRTSEDESDDLLEVPLFVLGPVENTADKGAVYGVHLTSELELFTTLTPTARVSLSPDAEQSGVTAATQRLSELAGQPLTDDGYSPDHFARAVVSECEELNEDEVLEDIWARDHEVWKDTPTEIADRLGWLDVAERMHGELKDLTEFARKARGGDAVNHIVLCGMGGSVLAGETFHSSIGGGIRLTVLDTTHPDHIGSVRDSLDLQHTLFVIGSKSGTTIETRAHLEYFWSLASRGDRFVAVTDPDSELATVAKERGFFRVFENPSDIGGRYSALSYFGLVPAALCGVDIEPIVAGARRAMARNSPGVRAGDAPAVRLGAALFEAHRDRSDKLTLVLPDRLHALGAWIEQLIAESTGKEGTGIVPVVGEELGPPVVYGDDRVFCVYTIGDEAAPPAIEALEADHPVIRIRMRDVKGLGAEMFRWEMATAIVGYSLDINPFDQPDVEAAKVRAREALGSGRSNPEKGSASTLLAELAAPKYLAIQAFIPPTDSNAKRLATIATKLRDRYKVAVTVGFGPRFLHSTGQLHKGGPQTGVFLQITDDPKTDIEVPGMGFTFGRLIGAQADGDLLALRDAGREAARVSLSELEAMG